MTDRSDIAAPPRVASFKSVAAFQAHLNTLPIAVACDTERMSGDADPLAQPVTLFGKRLHNRFAVQPMEGWDGTRDGRPSEHTVRRWANFGRSGAQLVWGGEALAVRPDGRANPNQLSYAAAHAASLAGLLATLRAAHRHDFGADSELVVGLQLTHSGRYCRPGPGHDLVPRVAYRHPLLDSAFGVTDDRAVFSDMELDDLIGDYVRVAVFAREAGFDFVDIKHCHGYLLHELLSAYTRPGPYGGSFEHRTRMLREIAAGIARDAKGLGIGARLSAFDLVPFTQPPPGAPPRGVPVAHGHLLPYRYGFGVRADDPREIDLQEPIAFLRLCAALGMPAVNVTGGSPYYTPHIQRPALFPPSDGYPPPEDPLLGCARMLDATAQLKAAAPGLLLVGTGYTYFQDYLPLVAQAQVRLGHTDFVGLGRMMLSYPDLAVDVLAQRALARGRICRTFSDCTTGPRNQLISGCFPLDPYYKALPEAQTLKALKRKKGDTGT